MTKTTDDLIAERVKSAERKFHPEAQGILTELHKPLPNAYLGVHPARLHDSSGLESWIGEKEARINVARETKG